MSKFKQQKIEFPAQVKYGGEISEPLGLVTLLGAITDIQTCSLASDQACRANWSYSGQLLFTQQLELIGIF